jgi:hypothetical protein
MMSEAERTKTVSKKPPYVAPQVVDYGDGREATKAGVGPGAVADGPSYTS